MSDDPRPAKYKTEVQPRPRLVFGPDFYQKTKAPSQPVLDPFAKDEKAEMPVARRQIAYNMGLGRAVERTNPWPARILLLALALVLSVMWMKPAWDRLTETHLIEIH